MCKISDVTQGYPKVKMCEKNNSCANCREAITSSFYMVITQLISKYLVHELGHT